MVRKRTFEGYSSLGLRSGWIKLRWPDILQNDQSKSTMSGHCSHTTANPYIELCCGIELQHYLWQNAQVAFNEIHRHRARMVEQFVGIILQARLL